MSKKYSISHLGKTLNTDHWYNLTQEECSDIRKLYYTKPDIDNVYNELIGINNGKSKNTLITKYYFKELMSLTKLSGPKWSISEMLECDDLIRYYYSRIIVNDKLFPKTSPLIDRIETAIRISGGGVCMKPSNFPYNQAKNIIKRYNTNNNYYDFSCGWGVRMLASMSSNINYFGTDPNYTLCDKLTELKTDYDTVNNTNTYVDIRKTGSEEYHSDWSNKMGLAFSSPPYFDLEDYKIGNQSITNKTYKEWIEHYLSKTLDNINDYLIKDGFLLINIKNINKYDLYDDIFDICKGKFKFHEEIILSVNKRPSAKIDLNTDEKIMVFKK